MLPSHPLVRGSGLLWIYFAILALTGAWAARHSKAQTVLANPVLAPIIQDDCNVGGTWYEDFYPYNDALPITISAWANREEFRSQIETAVPIAETENTVLAALLAHNYDYNESGATSAGMALGFVFQDLFSTRFRAHGDFMDSHYGNSVEQLSFGADVYTRYGINLHANFYLPGEEEYVIGEFSNTTGGQASRWFDDPFAAGNQIRQLQYDSIAPIVTRDYELREQARKGGDLRASFDVPLVSKFLSTRGTVGGYFYDGGFGDDDDLNGFLAGIHVFPLRGVMVGAEYYEDEELYGEKWTFTTAVTVPLDNIFSPRSWGRGLRNAFQQRPSPQQNSCDPFYLKGQLLSNANRRVRPLFEYSDPIHVNTEVQARNTTVTTKVIADDIVFVNNGGAVGNGIEAGAAGGDGTAENPTNTIQRGANLVESSLGGEGTVYVQDSGTPYIETTEVGTPADGTNVNAMANATGVTSIYFTSSFKPIRACAGRVFGGNTARPEVQGGFDIRDLQFAQVEGFHISAGVPGGSLGGRADGRDIFMLNNVTTVVNCNILSSANNSALEVRHEGVSGTIDIFENDISGYQADGGGGDRGIYAVFGGGADSSLRIYDNMIDGTGSSNNDEAIRIEVQGGSSLNNVEVFENTIANAGRHAIELNTAGGATVAAGRIDDNVITASGGNGMMFWNSGSTTLSSVSRNVIDQPNGVGIQVEQRANGSSWTAGQVNDNTITNGNNAGIIVNTNFANSISTINQLNNNTIDTVRNQGIRFQTQFSGAVNIGTIDSNTINLTGGHGIEAWTHNTNTGGNVVNIDAITNNTLTAVGNNPNGGGNWRSAIHLESRGDTTMTLGAIDGNTIDGVANAGPANDGGRGIYLASNETGTFTAAGISNNTISNVSARGINVNADGAGASIVTNGISGNTITNTAVGGVGGRGRAIHVEVNNAGGSNLNVGDISDNTIANVGHYGMDIRVNNAAGTLTVGTIANNNVSAINLNTGGNNTDAIQLANNNGTMNVGAINGNVIDATGGDDGVEAWNVTSVAASTVENTITPGTVGSPNRMERGGATTITAPGWIANGVQSTATIP